jgi:hypothetical protein
MQFAGGNGKAWPSVERIAEEIALSVPQTRRCVRALESKGFIRRVARSGRSNEFEFLWHASYEQHPQSTDECGTPILRECPTPITDKWTGAIVRDWGGAITGDRTGAIIGDRQKRIN